MDINRLSHFHIAWVSFSALHGLLSHTSPQQALSCRPLSEHQSDTPFYQGTLPSCSFCSGCSFAFPLEEPSERSLMLFAAWFLQQSRYKLLGRYWRVCFPKTFYFVHKHSAVSFPTTLFIILTQKTKAFEIPVSCQDVTYLNSSHIWNLSLNVNLPQKPQVCNLRNFPWCIIETYVLIINWGNLVLSFCIQTLHWAQPLPAAEQLSSLACCNLPPLCCYQNTSLHHFNKLL